MKNRKGFTITELVIVIAVIAILAAVLIPTFSSIITKSKTSSAMQEARNTFTEYMSEVDAQPADVVYVQGGDMFFKFNKGQIDEENPLEDLDDVTTGLKVTKNGNDIVTECLATAHDNDAECTSCNNQYVASADAG